MRILTVRQPWAGAIIHGGKDVENRVRNIAGDYRGPVAIHAAIQGSGDDQAISAVRAWDWWLDSDEKDVRGAIIGVVDLAGVHTADECWEQDLYRLARLAREDRDALAALPDSGAGGLVGKARMCSAWAQDDAHHLVLANPRALAEPIPFRGALGLRRLDDDMVARIEAAIA